MEAVFALAGKFGPAAIMGGLLAAFIWAVLTGRLVPRSTLEDVRADRDARLAELRKETDDVWTALRASQDTIRVLSDQIDELSEVGRTTHQLIQALPGPLARPRGGRA